MKVALTGSHATGKTTLCQYISDKYGLPLLQEQARYYMEHGFEFEKLEKNFNFFIDFQNRVLDSQIQDQKTSAFVTDRTLLDSVAYTKERYIKERCNDREHFNNYFKKAVENLPDYDLIFFLKVQDSMLESDGFRNINVFYTKAIEDLLLDLYRRLNIKPVMIDTDSLEDRKAIIDLYMKGVKF